MTHYRVSHAAQLLGVSDDTVRRWVSSGAIATTKDESGRSVVAGADLAAKAKELASAPPDPSGMGSSARNRFVGLVTSIVSDAVMAQVDLQCGPHRVVSLMSAEAVRDLRLEVGSLAVAVVKATTVIVESPRIEAARTGSERAESSRAESSRSESARAETPRTQAPVPRSDG